MSDDPDDLKNRKPGQFAPGHKYLPPPGGAAPVGKDNHTRRANRMLSIVLREKLPPEQIADYLWKMANGVDPSAEPGSVNAITIDARTRLKAMTTILERMYGQPAQHVHMEAEVKAAVGVVRATIQPGAVKALPAQELGAFRSTLRSILGMVGSASVQHQVLELTPREALPSEAVPDEEPPPDGEPGA